MENEKIINEGIRRFSRLSENPEDAFSSFHTLLNSRELNRDQKDLITFKVNEYFQESDRPEFREVKKFLKLISGELYRIRIIQRINQRAKR